MSSEISDWLYEDGSNADKATYDDKFKSLKLITKGLQDRVREHKDGPDALDALDKMLNISMGFLESSKSLSESEQLFTEVELSTLEKLVQETWAWGEKKLEEQEKTALNVASLLTIRQIAEKIDGLDREVKYMVNKARVKKLQKQRQEEKDKAKAENEANNTKETSPKPEESAQGEQPEVIPEEENIVDTGDSSDRKEEGAQEKVTPTPSEPEDTHTEL